MNSVIQSILTNTSVVEKDVFDSSMLELTTYEECDENYIFPKELDIIHQLLPCELDTSPIYEAAIIESTTIIELSKGHNPTSIPNHLPHR